MKAKKKLNSIQQTHLLNNWQCLSFEEKKKFLKDIQKLDLSLLQKQQALLKTTPQQTDAISPIQDYALWGEQVNFQKGEQLLSEGKVGCIIIAGGQGTRLQFEGPKGLFPITHIKKKSLFQLFSEKTTAASQKYQKTFPIAIMTSSLNHKTIIDYFKKNHQFGLQEKQLTFFSQKTLPLLDQKGNLFLSNPCQIAEGPDGNGLALKNFWQSGIGEEWKKAGIQVVNFIPIDNPLADPFDAELIGYHALLQNEVTLKCTLRRSENEKVGVVIKQHDHFKVLEYSELPELEKKSLTLEGSLKYFCANLSLFCFDINFIQKHAQSNMMPLHLAYKPAKHWLSNSQQEKIMAWKYEYFIFDILLETYKVGIILYPREICFAPLKNLEGEDDVKAVREALQQKDRMIIEKITNIPPPSRPFELSQSFHYPSRTLLERWKNRELPSQSYIEDNI